MVFCYKIFKLCITIKNKLFQKQPIKKLIKFSEKKKTGHVFSLIISFILLGFFRKNFCFLTK